jgi:hypothetical protein
MLNREQRKRIIEYLIENYGRDFDKWKPVAVQKVSETEYNEISFNLFICEEKISKYTVFEDGPFRDKREAERILKKMKVGEIKLILL